MSGPFVLESDYPWDRLRNMPIFVTEGTRGTRSMTGSRELRDWTMAGGYAITYKEVDADHPGMVPLVLPDAFDFFDGPQPPRSSRAFTSLGAATMLELGRAASGQPWLELHVQLAEAQARLVNDPGCLHIPEGDGSAGALLSKPELLS